MQRHQFTRLARNNQSLFFNIFIPGAVVLCFAYLLWLLILNTGLNFDEGYNLQVPLNLLRDGVYGSRTIAGITIFDPFISSGPVFLLPIALVFRLFGISVINARMVCLLISILLIIGIYVLNHILRKTTVTLLGLGLLFTVQASLLRFILILGDVLGIGLVVAGMIVWSIAEKKQSTGYALAAGLLLGSSVWAKPSMVMAVAFVILAILLSSVRRKYPFLPRVILVVSITAFAVSAAWFTLSIFMTRSSGTIVVGEASRLVEEQFDLQVIRNIRNNYPMMYKTISLAVILASIINILRDRRKEDYRSIRIASSLLPSLWIIWWLLFNRFTLERHLFPGLIFGIIPITQFFIHSVNNKGGNWLKVLIAIILIIGSLPAIKDAVGYFSHLDQQKTIKVDQERMANYVAKLPQDAQIMGWGWYMDWDIAFLSQRDFGDLSTKEILLANESVFLVVTLTIKNSYILDYYILPIINRCSGVLIYQQGGYDLYEIKGLCKLQEN